ncbi:MAG TPA: GNAT family protein [Micromonosporaceae bacterium]
MYTYPLTDTATLRPLEPWRAEEFLAHLDRARVHIAPWVGPGFVATDLDSARTVLRRYADAVSSGGGGIHGIWLDGTLVGGVLFVSLDSASGVCEVGCWLEPAAEGRGLVTRAIRLLIDWAVRDRGMHRVEWHTLATNERSIHVAQRLGMRRDGVMRQSVPARDGSGTRADLEVWSILAHEWLSAAEGGRTP